MNKTFAKSAVFLFFICLISCTQLFSQALNLGSNFILCSNSNNPSTISADTTGLGINSVISYAWRINSTIISNSISTLSVSPNLSTNPQIVSCIVTLSNSNTISDTVKVYTIYPGTISSGIQIACNSSGYDPSLFGSTNNGTMSLIGTPNFSYSYQWQISTDNINWTTIPNTNSATYDSPQINTTSYFRRAIIVSIGNDGNSISTTCYSNVIDVQFLVTNTPTFNFPVTGCPGTSYFPSNFTPQAGTSYVWTVSPSSNSTGLTTNSPSFIFNNGGSYSVSVTATTNNSGCSATSSTASITLPSLSILKPTIKVGIASYNTTNANPNTIAICTGVLTSFASIVNNGPNTNPSGTTYTYSFNSGPATSIGVLIPSADITLTYGNNPLVITSNFNGCSQSITVNVYSGSNPYVSLGTSNSVGLCIGDSLAFFIDPIPQSGQANPPGTTYTLTYSDVTNSTVFPVIIDDTTIIHTYNNTSCGATYLGGFYPSNTFFAKVTAQNFCGQTSSFVSPITVNNAPVADFTLTDSTFFAGQTITATITGVSGNVIGSSPPYDCNSEGKFYWVITGGVIGTNFNLTSGSLGSYNSNYINLMGQPDYTDNGSSSIGINFITAGYYTITLHYYNNCGIKTKVSNICVITPPVCQFSVSPSSGCSPLTVNINNSTVAPTCNGTNVPLSYTWTVTSPTDTSVYTSNSTQTPPTLVLTNPLTSSQTFTITLTVNPNEPGDTSQNFSIHNNSISICSQTVVVNPIPIFTPFNITSCSTQYQANINLQSSTNIANSSFSWFAISNTNINGESTTTQSSSIIFDPIENNSSSYQTVNYTVTPTSNLGCVGPTVNSSSITMNYVTPGTIATEQTICSGTIPATITSISLASGYGIFCYQWQLSTDNVNWTDIESCLSTNTTYSPGTLSQNTYFRRVVKYLSNGTTCSDFSNAILITINSFTAPTISASQNICSGIDPAILTISSSATGTALIYQWQSSTASSSTGFNNIANQTGLSYDPPVLTGNTWYRLIVTSTLNGLTCPANSNTILISVYNLSPGSIGNNQTICTGGDPTEFTSSPGSSVGTILTYQWQSSLNNIFWGNILNATSETYDPGVLSTTTYFRRVVIDTLNGTAICQDYSNTLSISVVPVPIINTQSLNQSLCIEGIPTPISVAPSLGIGTNYTYQWYSSSLNSTTGGTLITISGTDQSYSPPSFNILNNTHYYCVVSQSELGCVVTSIPILISFVADPTVTAPSGASYCQGASTVVPLSVTASGGSSANYSYQWHNGPIPTGIISGATASTYTPPVATTGTTSYYCIVTINPATSTGCSVTSATALITMNSPTFTTQPIASQIVCLGGSFSPLNVFYPIGTGTPTYQWFSNSTNSTSGGSPLSGASLNTYIPLSNLVGTTYYYCVATFTSVGCTAITSTIASAVVVADPTVNIQPIPSQSICVGGTISTELTASAINGTGTTSYQWSNTAGTISGATNQTYLPPSFTSVGTYTYLVTITLSGSGCNAAISQNTVIDVVPNPIVSVQPISASYCQDGSPVSQLSVAVSGGLGTFNYQWYSNNTNSNTGGTILTGANTSTYTPSVANIGTIYYYCVITQSGLNCGITSNTAGIVVNQLPSFLAQPISQTICSGGTFDALSISYQFGTGTPTYQWFSNSTNSTSGGSPLSGASLNTYIPLSNLVGTTYYYCVATFTSVGCTAITSTIASAVVVADPTVNIQPIPSQSICVGGTISTELTASAINGTGTTSYQWSNTAGTISGATNQTYLPPSFTSVGTYTYLVTITLSGSGCNAAISQNTVIDVVPNPIVSVQPISASYCQDGSPVSQLSVAVSGGLGVFNYQWYSNTANSNSGGSIIPSATDLSYTPTVTTVGTIYYYCIISQNGLNCSVNSNTASIIVYPLPIFYMQPIASQTLCEGGTPTTLEVSYIYGTNSASYQWYESNTNSNTGGTPLLDETNSSYTPPTLIIGSLYYYCVITFQQVGCSTLTSATAHITVVNDPAINTQTLNSQEICQGNTINSPLNFTFSGGTGNATIAWYLNASPPVLINGITDSSYLPIPFNVADTFSYYATLSIDGVGCNNVFTEIAEIIVHPTPYALNLNNTNVVCNNVNLSILLTASVPSTFVWHASNNPYVTGESFLNQTSNAIDDSLSNNSTNPEFLTYTITPTSLEGCVGPDSSLTVQVQQNILLNIPQNLEICSGSAVNAVLNANVSSNFQWFVSINNPNVNGESLISNTSNIISDILINNTTTNQVVIYSVFPISVLGICNGQAQTITIIVKPQLALLNTDTLTICSNESVNLNLVANTNVTLNWYADQSLNVINETTSVTTSSIINDVLINSTGQVQEVTYNVTGTSTIDGCSTPIIPITVFVNPLPTVNPSADLNLCDDIVTNPILFTGNVIGSVYSWATTSLNLGIPTLTGINSIPSFSTTNSGLSPISSIVEVTPIFINNNIQCEGPIDQFTITVNPVPSVFPVSNIILCEGELSSSVILLGTLGGTIFNWVNSNVSVGLASPGTGNIPVFTAQNPTLLPIQSTVTVTPLYGLAQCPGDDILFDITVKPAPTINPQTVSICSGETLDINLSADLPCTFQWFATPNLNVLNETYTPIQNTDIINDILVQTTTIPQTVQYNISAISTQYNCESSPIIFNVIVNPLPAPSFTILNPPFCDLSPISFQNNTTGILDFIWSFGDGIYSNLYSPSHQFPTFGSYDVQLNAINPQTLCTNSIVNQIIISDTPSAAFSYSDSLGCDFLDVTYTAVSSNLTWGYFWDFGNGVTSLQASSVGYQFEEEGCFDVSLTVTNNNGCSSSDTIAEIACIYASPIASFSTDQDVFNEIDPLVSFYNNSVNASSFKWEFGDGTNSLAENPIHTYPDDATSYLVTLVAYNEISCADSTSMRIIILKDVGLYVPNSFSPDGDEYNHTFYPILTEGYKKDSYHMSIFDRWGEIVFETYDPSFGWNGTYKNGIQCQIGTYTWVIEVIELQSAVNRKFNGHVNLIR